jgi:hypothetical protein
MSVGLTPCLSLAIARLTTAGSKNFAIWVIKSPLPGGYVHHDSMWTDSLTQKWLAWQTMFSLQSQPSLPIPQSSDQESLSLFNLMLKNSGESYGGRLMQELGISLWQWVFDGEIRQSLAQSQGIAMGKNKPLRLQLEIRDPNLIPLPWEIMQPETGKPSIALNPQFFFSRTTSDVDPLIPNQSREALNILLVLGEATTQRSSAEIELDFQTERIVDPRSTQTDSSFSFSSQDLQLEAEAAALTQAIEQYALADDRLNPFASLVPARVQVLIKPTPTEAIKALDSGIYNVFFYGGHGVPAPDGGLLYLRSDVVINGTELAQVLVRNQVTLAVFNACWGAQPARQGQTMIERSSLAEVLIHHGVPAVLGMRDSIADGEALSFIQALTKALAQRLPIDQAVAIARQQLLTLYKLNHPAWTLPILYMHPEFDGELIKPIDEGITELPMMLLETGINPFPVAYLCSPENRDKRWKIQGGRMRVGRRQENDLAIQERWVSQRHAEITCREIPSASDPFYCYFLRDFSRFGTLINQDNEWKTIHHQEVGLTSGVQLKFGSPFGQILEFIVED